MTLVAVWQLIHAGSAAAAAIGEPLADALHELQRDGVRIIFSSQTVPPTLRVVQEPTGTTTEERLRSLLLPHGLDVRSLSGGVWVVVEGRPAPPVTLIVDVTSEPDGGPVRGAVVSVPEAHRVAHTDAHGRARIPGLKLTAYTVSIRAEGYGAWLTRRDPSSSRSGDPLAVRLTRVEAPLAEVVVQTSRYGIDAASLGTRTERSRSELEATPGTNEDIARALQQLPGATAGGFSARTHVRGSRDNETLFRYDGVTLVDPYHLKDFQSMFSAIDPSITDTTAFWTGAFPIEFGQRIGAVVDIEPRTITARTVELGLSVLNSSLLAGTAFDQERGSLLVSGRVSNLSRVSQWLDRDVGEPEFQDLLIRLTWNADEHTSLAAGLLGLEDSIDVFTTSRSQRAHADYHDSYAWLRLHHDFGANLASETLVSRASLSDARSGTAARAGVSSGNLSEDRHSSFETLRQELHWSPSPSWYLRAGTEVIRNVAHYDLASNAQYFAPFFPDLVSAPLINRATETTVRGWTQAAYASARWEVVSGSTAELGVRRDAQSLRGRDSDVQWNLRANFRQRLSPATTLRLGWGQFSQAPWVNQLELADGVTSLPSATRLTQMNVGVEHAFDAGWLVRAEIYDKREAAPVTYFENVFTPLVLLPELEFDRTAIHTSGATMRGLEVTLESDRARELSGWLSYAWSRAEDRIAGIAVPRSWDQRHTVQAGLAWSPGRWQLSGVLNWHSGWPFTPLEASSLAWTDPASVSLALGPRNSSRFSDYLSVDLRATYERPFARGMLQTSLELRNAFDDESPCCRSYTVGANATGQSELREQTGNWLGVTPLIGLRYRY